jgi:uncharacterized protein YcfJ
MKKIILASVLMLGACSTPSTTLIHPTTKQTVQCGGSATGSLIGGVIGYQIEKSNAQDCVVGYLEAGFERVGINNNSEAHYTNKPNYENNKPANQAKEAPPFKGGIQR